MQNATVAESILRRDRWITIVGLCTVTVGAWAYILAGAGTGMNVWAMTTWSFPPPFKHHIMAQWTAVYWVIMLGMWWIMMIAMMIPSATPMILLYARVSRHSIRKGRMAGHIIPTAAFLSGYLLAWLFFSAVATALQWTLEQLGLLHGMFMWSNNLILSGALLVVAGFYQLSKFKTVCLEHCRSPAEYLSRHWHDGRWGALRMGGSHGAYCLGCCWALMALLFVGGAMNLVWIAGLAMYVLIEKLAPFGERIAQAIGAGMIVVGGLLLIAPSAFV
ncbi:MAG: DUF2182 domain-containing protein [Hyphomicrobiaceae bacterium]